MGSALQGAGLSLRHRAERLPQEQGLLKPGQKALSIGDGEGRNGVFLASLGLDVLATDFSPSALAKSQALAKERGVTLRTELADLETWQWPVAAFDVVVGIFFQFLVPASRTRVFANIKRADRALPLPPIKGLARADMMLFYDQICRLGGEPMRRREFIAAIGGAALLPLNADAQQAKSVAVLMNGGSAETPLQQNLAALVQELKSLGWVEGKNLKLEVRWNNGSAERSRALAAELVGSSPDVVVCASTTNLLAVRNLTRTIPLVFVQVSDPVAQGFVTSLTKPGGNATGFSAYEFAIAGKWLELLKQMAPGLTRAAMMVNPDTSPQSSYFMKAIEAAASGLGLRVEAAPVRSDQDIERAIENAANQHDGGLIVPTDSFTRRRGARIAELALKFRVPVIAAFAEFTDQGGLMYYGNSALEILVEQFRQAASYVDRILKGAKPGDLPVQIEAKYTLAINRKTATALGLEIPARLLFTAEKVIE